ncbi:MAG TPA: hypothetical protein VGS27_26005 [Candidatus Sulfotelmatobacter sp.]|nr:hypothetical protein [Candidatus Sulfotelmatobacter sp.]
MPYRSPFPPATFVIPICLLALAGCGNPPTACPASNCSYLYAAGNYNSQMAAFPVNASTGALGSPITIPGPSASFGITAFNGQFLYASDSQPTAAFGSSIDAWSINAGTGKLAAVPGSPFAIPPVSQAGGLAIDNDIQVLYVGDVGKIDAFKIEADGALTPIVGSPFPAADNLNITIDPQHRFLFGADDTPPGNILAFTIDSSTGALTPVPGSPFVIGAASANGQLVLSDIVVDSSGKFLYVAIEQGNRVVGFSIMASNGALLPLPGSPFETASGPDALATAHNFLYVSSPFNLSGYGIDPQTGVLTPLPGSPFANNSASLTADPQGKFLFDTGGVNVTAYEIDAQGRLTQVGTTPNTAAGSALTYVP